MTARVLVALLVFGVLFGAFIFILRRFGVGTLVGAAPSRGRQPRLSVTEAAPVGDGKRQLLLIRRDNIEHLVMTGGPSDVVIETNIVRASAVASTRESAPARAADALPRALPLAEGAAWPPQPEPGARPSRVPVAAREEAEEEAPAETAAPRVAAERESGRESVRETVRDGAMRIQASDRITGLADLQRNITEVPAAPPPRRGAEPRRTPPQPVPPISPSEEQNLAEMAQRLETALQRPRPAAEPPPAVAPPPVAAPVPRAVEPAPEPVLPAPEPKPEPRPEPKPVPKPVPKPKVASAAAFDSLEQEMASLLGRPSGKT